MEGLGPFIQSLYADFIQKENCIILYVTSAKTDLVTGQAIEFIDKYDPEWQRTMTIVTKIDGRDENFLNNFNIVDRGLGALCVRNRTQRELDDGTSYDEVLQKERVLLQEADF